MPIQRITAVDDNRWQLDALPSIEFDQVVVATPAKISAKLLAVHAPVAAEQLRAIESSSVAIVCLGVRQQDIQRPIETFGFVVPQAEQRRILAASFASTKFAGRAPQGHVLIRVFIGGACQAELLQHDDAGLVQIARDELASLIGLSGQPVVQRVVRWPDSMPQYHVGHLQRVEKIDRSIDQIPGLSLISNALHGVGIAPVIGAAKQTADRVIAALHGSPTTLS